MHDDVKRQLLLAADRFRAWARDTYPNARFGEWETTYEGWDAVYESVTRFIRGYHYDRWDSVERQALLYLIARDNESELLVDVLAEDPARLLALARDAVVSTENEARCQIAERLGNLRENREEATALLVQFAQDEQDDEYVRRRALLALGRLGSDEVHGLVEKAWSTGLEYQRVAVLHVLYALGSPSLPEYLARADADGREHLVANAARIRSGKVD